LEADGVVVVVPLAAGVPGTPQSLGNGFLPGSIACPAMAICYVVGQSTDTDKHGVVVELENGQVASNQSVAAPLFEIACPSEQTCYAVARGAAASSGTIVSLPAGVVAGVQSIAGVDALSGIACPSEQTCYAVGRVGDGPALIGVVVSLLNGVAGPAQPAPDANGLYAIACLSDGLCYAVGRSLTPNLSFGGDSVGGAVVRVANGTPDPAWVVAKSDAGLDDVACSPSGVCEAVGGLGGPPAGWVVPIGRDGPGPSVPAADVGFLVGVACPSDTVCYAVGGNAQPNSTAGLIVTISIRHDDPAASGAAP